MSTTPNLNLREGYAEKFGFHDEEKSFFKSRRGLDTEIIEMISEMKGEPKWMRDYRLKAFEIFGKKPLPMWGARTTLSMRKRSGSTCGSFSKTSNPAPAICLFFSACTSAISSTTGPRAVFTTMHAGFIIANARSFSRCVVSADSGT